MFPRRLFVASLLLGAVAPAAPSPAKLALVKPVFRGYDGGPAAAPGTSFNTGDTVFFNCQVEGYQVSQENKVQLRYTLEAVDPGGVPIAEAGQREINTEVSPEDKNWRPLLTESVLVPPLAFGGQYRIRVRVEDQLSHQSAQSEYAFTVRGKQLEPGDNVTARNFRFLHAEDDQNAMLNPVYHPGEPLWARFDIVGFHYGAKNRIHVEYGIAVLNAEGKPLFTQPNAAVEEGESFYPKRYLGGALSLNLDKNVRPGSYAILLTLRDEVGGQTSESTHPFRVE